MTALNQAIAQHLNVTEQAVIKVEEWANCLFTVVKGIGARFVSKKVKSHQTKKATKLKVLSFSHLTSKEVKVVKELINRGWESGKSGKKEFFINRETDNTFTVKVVESRKDDWGRKINSVTLHQIKVW